MFLFFTKHGNKETKKISEIVEIVAGGYLCINEKEDLICAVAALIFLHRLHALECRVGIKI